MLGGGLAAYFSAKSLPSLITSSVAALFIFGGAFISLSKPATGFGLVGTTCVVLSGLFVKRYIDTGKPMPAFGLLGLCILMLILLAVGHFAQQKSA